MVLMIAVMALHRTKQQAGQQPGPPAPSRAQIRLLSPAAGALHSDSFPILVPMATSESWLGRRRRNQTQVKPGGMVVGAAWDVKVICRKVGIGGLRRARHGSHASRVAELSPKPGKKHGVQASRATRFRQWRAFFNGLLGTEIARAGEGYSTRRPLLPRNRRLGGALRPLCGASCSKRRPEEASGGAGRWRRACGGLGRVSTNVVPRRRPGSM